VCYPSRSTLLVAHPVQFSLSPDPRSWGSDLSPDLVEPDDSIHNPEKHSTKHFVLSKRGVANLGCLAVLSMVFLALL